MQATGVADRARVVVHSGAPMEVRSEARWRGFSPSLPTWEAGRSGPYGEP